MNNIKSIDKEFKWRTGRSCVYNINLHLVFVTKYRQNVFTPEILSRLNSLFKETCEQMGGKLHEFNGENDHVHLLVSYPPKLAVANLIGKLKGKSSYFLRKEYHDQIKDKLWGNHFWSPSYCAVSCGGAPLKIIKQYIQNQQKPISQKNIKKSLALTGKKRTRLTRP
jgi:putative transposase